jgi:hypothetical protein
VNTNIYTVHHEEGNTRQRFGMHISLKIPCTSMVSDDELLGIKIIIAKTGLVTSNTKVFIALN